MLSENNLSLRIRLEVVMHDEARCNSVLVCPAFVYILYSVQCTRVPGFCLHTVQCTLYSVLVCPDFVYIMYSVHYTVYSYARLLFTYCTVYSVRTVYSCARLLFTYCIVYTSTFYLA